MGCNGTFQFTPLREGRPAATTLRARLSNFNSRPSARGDCYGGLDLSSTSDFNSRPSARGDRRFLRMGEPVPFQFTPLREGRPDEDQHPARDHHFNSRPSARGDQKNLRKILKKVLFQFTPLREGRRNRRTRGCSTADFNSRPSARGDENEVIRHRKKRNISIHAPPRGATRSAPS